MTVEQSNRGVHHLVDELGGKHLPYAGYRCQGDSTVEGENTLWGPCLIHTIQRGGDTLSQRLFGPIVARGGSLQVPELQQQALSVGLPRQPASRAATVPSATSCPATTSLG